MASIQSYTRSLEKLEELYRYLDSFIVMISITMVRYQAKLSAFENEGVPTEVIDRFRKDFLPQSKRLIVQIEDVINNRAIPYVKRQIQGIEHQFGKSPTMFKRTAAVVGAGVASLAGAFAKPTEFFDNTTNEAPGNYAVLDSDILTPYQAAERSANEQGFIMKIGDVANAINDIADNVGDVLKQKKQREETDELNNVLQGPGYGQYPPDS